MTIFVLYDKTSGRITGNAEAPFDDPTAFETAGTGALIVDNLPPEGMRVVDGEIVPAGASDFAPEQLAEAKFDARAKAAAAVGQARRAFVSDFPGQSMIYADKEKEAIAYLSPEPSDLSDFYWLPKEVGVTAPTAYELAQLWLNMAALWRSAGPEIERLRMAFQSDLSAADTTASVATAVNNLMTGLEVFTQQGNAQ